MANALLFAAAQQDSSLDPETTVLDKFKLHSRCNSYSQDFPATDIILRNIQPLVGTTRVEASKLQPDLDGLSNTQQAILSFMEEFFKLDGVGE